jgi:glycosyltransferase involved in cell wall biosynthesis
MKIAFITNICPHYHVKGFEQLAKEYDAEFMFCSGSGEQYFGAKNKVYLGNFRGEYLKGFNMGFGLRIVPSLFTRVLFGRHDVIIKCITGRFALPVTFILCKLLKKPFILWTNIWMHPQTLFHRLSFPIVKYIYRRADALVVYGEHVESYLRTLGVSREKIFISHNVVDNSLFSKPVSLSDLERLREKLALQKSRVILFVGRFEEEKGLSYLLEAYSILAQNYDIALVLIGDGNQKNQIREFCWTNNLQNVRIVSHVDNQMLYVYYALADVFVLPSVTTATTKEPWGLVINEAMNQGCPIVTTDAVGGAMCGLVKNGENGFVVKERDHLALQRAIERIISDDLLAAKMRTKSRGIIQSFDYDHWMEGFRRAIEYVREQMIIR